MKNILQFPFPRPVSQRGFTLIELLTVIAIIGILASILIPVVGRVRESAKRATCASNIRQLGMSVFLLAQDEYEDRIPNIANNTWLHQILPKYADSLIEDYDLSRDVFFCPGNSSWNRDSFWADRSVRLVIGYAVIAGNPLISDPENPDKDYPMSLTGETRRKEMIADLVMRHERNFADRTGHHDAGSATGGNIFNVDGSVEWRPFSEMSLQLTSGEGFQYFW